ncbi:DUF2288 domain-containing protein [Pantanalinema sp. GBBB05]|uniref:DUF2288 domain-containing protein n=1 Tax=Pantanalinema sp. GBBB05 TaxID=2604139 RepID=UPI001D5F604E|nr:DUF2288 family protein [Pantanalinema sp. GBBB05]
MQDLRAELAESLDEAEWDWLAPHAERESLILVDSGLNLLDVGVAIANDNVSYVQRWIDEALIYKPSPSQVAVWSHDLTKRFQALIVQPFVLIQEMGEVRS